MCFADEQENALLLLSPFFHETLLTRRTLRIFTFRFNFHHLLFFALLLPFIITIIILWLDLYFYYFASSAFGFGIERIS